MKTGMSWLYALLVAGIIASVPLSSRAQEQSSPFDAVQKEALEKIIRDYLMENPRIIIEAVQGLEQQQRAAEAERARIALTENREALEADAADPVMGNPMGDVTVVEFFDYRCPYCRRMIPAMEELLESDPGVRWVFKEFPILGPDSLYAARAALAVEKQGAYEAFHLALMADGFDVTKENVDRVVESLSLNKAQFEADLVSAEIEGMLAKNHALAGQLGINGTPAFVVGNTLLPGAVSLAQLRQAIQLARDTKS
ncbi:DsbA family protein [Limibacillus halophilus]|uniref:Protein-disulfide isomerase n=1 Tax=Limibacillus halophilus TaxID=1579333 RepID=A0A839SVU2_9PROT|nr:DsbA family protein [Limibacillus halophilus]MBB3065063.1 protein-disulfide isomerase [Limibacillus halophilus]